METLQSDQLEEKPTQKQTLPSISVSTVLLSLCVVALLVRVELITNRLEGIEDAFDLVARKWQKDVSERDGTNEAESG